MNIVEFNDLFPNEEACKMKLKEYREKEGVICPMCGCKHHCWKRDKQCFECKECGYRQSLKANTVMHGSQLPLRYWFVTMHLLTSTKKSFSASELQRHLSEYCWKFNRRYFGDKLFERLIITSINYKNEFRYNT